MRGILSFFKSKKTDTATVANQQPVADTTVKADAPLFDSLKTTSNSDNTTIDKKYGHFQYSEIAKEELAPLPSQKGILLQKDAAKKYNDMYKAAKEEGINLQIVSGMRTVKYQKEVFKRGHKPEEVRAKVSAPAGYSEHHTGYAIDFNNLTQGFEKTKEFKWLEKNAGKYGFEMSFPKDNPQGVSYEPWHWRYVGDEKSRAAFKAARDLNPRVAGNCLDVIN